MQGKGRRRPKQVTVKLSVPFVGEVSGVWEPVDAERSAAWELYVELVTRVTVVELRPDEGLLREALSSLYSLFGTARDILRRYGPDIAPRRTGGRLSFGELSVTVLNGVLRPILARWHPALTAYESRRPPEIDPVAWERAWERADELRQVLTEARDSLKQLSAVLAEVAGAADLLSRPGNPKPPKTAGGGVSSNGPEPG